MIAPTFAFRETELQFGNVAYGELKCLSNIFNVGDYDVAHSNQLFGLRISCNL